jgi:hypothetical protein
MLTNPFFNMFPVTAGNWQTIDTRWWSPTVSVNFAGNPAVEREVTEDVASYGRQIGWLGDIVLALAEAGGEEVIKRKSAAADSLIKLRQAQERIQEIKQRRKNIALDNARGALANLAAADKAAYARLVRSLDADKPPGK